MTESEKQLIVRLWDGGVPVKKIPYMLPHRHGECVSMIKELRKDGTLAPRKRESKEQLVVEAYQSGMTDREQLCEKYRLTDRTIRTYLQRNGINTGRPKHYKKREMESKCENTQQIVREIKRGKPMAQIARDFGVSRQYVWELNKKWVEQ